MAAMQHWQLTRKALLFKDLVGLGGLQSSQGFGNTNILWMI